MRVLLIDPPVTMLDGTGATRMHVHLGLGYLGALLRQAGHEARLLLCDLQPYRGADPWGRVRAAIQDEQPDVIGITGVTAAWASMVETIRRARQAVGPAIPIVVGGPHATNQPEATARLPGVTCVVRGEGEDSMLALVQGWAKEGPKFDLSRVPRTWQIVEGEVIKGPLAEPRSDLDALPYPQRDGIVWDDHTHPVMYEGLITQRGCPYRCIYCSIPRQEDSKTRHRTAGPIVDELTWMVERWDPPSFTFYDSVFTLSRKRTLALLAEKQARGIQQGFDCQTRADRVDPVVLDALAEAGCTRVFYGIESGDVATLERLQKAMPLQRIVDAVAMTRARGMKANGFFMVGFPWETAELVEKTVAFALGLGLDMVSLFSVTPMPGTELWDMGLRDKGKDTDLDQLRGILRPTVNMTAMPDAQFAELFTRLRARCLEYNRLQHASGLRATWPGALPDRAVPPGVG